MRVTVEVVGDRVEEVSLDEGTYGAVLSAVGLSPHEASVFVDGRPKPVDGTVTETEVQVLRLVQGG
jgi:sulfur carrier protein